MERIATGFYTGWHWSPATASLAGGQYRADYYLGKRVLDMALVVPALILLAPLFVVIGILIKLDSPGPVFFIQERIGSRLRRVNGEVVWEVRKFRLYKFRSMFHNVDETLHREHIRQFVQGTLAARTSSSARVKLDHDPRITRIGAILRKSSLDELPQLFNVLRGEMSLVGPRPVPEYEVQEYREAWHHERLAALPGLTGLWQVQGRGQVEFEEMIQLDLEYIRRQSFWFDLRIVLLTIPAVMTGRGAE